MPAYFCCFTSDLATFTSDQRLLIGEARFDYVEGQIVPDASGGWRYMLEAASFYTPPESPNNIRLLSGLSYTQGTEQIEDKSYFDFANRLALTVAFLKQSGVWFYPYPWLDLFVPGTAVERFVGEIVSNLTLADTGQGLVLLYPVITDRLTLPLVRVPNQEVVFLFSILRTAPPDASAIARMLEPDILRAQPRSGWLSLRHRRYSLLPSRLETALSFSLRQASQRQASLRSRQYTYAWKGDFLEEVKLIRERSLTYSSLVAAREAVSTAIS